MPLSNTFTIREFIEECDNYPRSVEFLDLYESACEIDMYESYYFEDVDYYLMESKKEGLFSRVVSGFSRVIQKCCKSLRRIFTKVSESEPVSLDNIRDRRSMLNRIYTRADCSFIINFIGPKEAIFYQTTIVEGSKDFPEINFEGDVDKSQKRVVENYLRIMFDKKARIYNRSLSDTAKRVGGKIISNTPLMTAGGIAIAGAIATIPFFNDLALYMGAYLNAGNGSSHKERVAHAKDQVQYRKNLNTPGTKEFSEDLALWEQFFKLKEMVDKKYSAFKKGIFMDQYDEESIKKLNDILNRVEELSKEFESQYKDIKTLEKNSKRSNVINAAATTGLIAGGITNSNPLTTGINAGIAIASRRSFKKDAEAIKTKKSEIEGKLQNNPTQYQEMADLVRKMTEMLGTITSNNAKNVTMMEKCRASFGRLKNMFNKEQQEETEEE